MTRRNVQKMLEPLFLDDNAFEWVVQLVFCNGTHSVHQMSTMNR